MHRHRQDGYQTVPRRQNPTERGEIAAAMLRDFDVEATLKGFYPDTDAVRFAAANDAHADIAIPLASGSRREMLGKLVGTP